MSTTVEISGLTSPAQKTLIKAWWKKVTLNNPNALYIPEMKQQQFSTGN